MTLQDIFAAIPHRPPMLLLDAIVHRDESRIVCTKAFRSDEYFFQGHYPDYPLVPGVILCECGMQAGAVLLAQFAGQSEQVPVATRINDVRFKQMVRPGDEITIEVHLKERLANAWFLDAKITRDGKTVVRFEFACTLASME